MFKAHYKCQVIIIIIITDFQLIDAGLLRKVMIHIM